MRGAIDATVLLFVLAFAMGTSRALAVTPEQLRLSLHPNPDMLVASFVTLGAYSTLGALVKYGASPSTLNATSRGTAASYVDDLCKNTTRTVYVVPFAAPRDAVTYYAVSADGGSTWSATRNAVNFDPRKEDLQLSIFGDMAVNVPASSVPALVNDTLQHRHDVVILNGDSAYNMDDQCVGVGDTFLNAVSAYAATTPTLYGPGNHETGPNYKYLEYTARLGAAQASLGAASGSNSTEYYAAVIGRVFLVVISADFYIYPLVWDRAGGQWAWLNKTLAGVDRSVTPWIVLATHRAMYCTKVANDGECNSEAETLRYGFLGLEYGLEQLLVQYGVDLVFR